MKSKATVILAILFAIRDGTPAGTVPDHGRTISTIRLPPLTAITPGTGRSFRRDFQYGAGCIPGAAWLDYSFESRRYMAA